jgi:hypothetical protein
MFAHGFSGLLRARGSLLALVLAAALSLVSVAEARAAGATDLGAPGGMLLSLAGISNDGQVVGWVPFGGADNASRAFTGSATEGMVPRCADPGDVVNHAFSWARAGGMATSDLSAARVARSTEGCILPCGSRHQGEARRARCGVDSSTIDRGAELRTTGSGRLVRMDA